MEQTKQLPKMRTAAGAIREIRAMDPNTEITECAIRRAIKRGEVASVENGIKRLVNLDDLLTYFARGGSRTSQCDT